MGKVNFQPLGLILALCIMLVGFQSPLRAVEKVKQGINLDRNSKIIVAVRANDVEYVRAYLDDGGNVQARTTGEWAKESTLLHHAADSGSFDVAVLLARSGADLEAENKHYSATPLHRAALQGHAEIVELLLDRGAKIDVLNKYGKTPLFNAVTYGQLAVVRTLLKHGAMVNYTKSEDGPPIMATASIGRSKVISDPPQLMWSDSDNAFPILNTLIDHGADVYVLDNEERTLIDKWVINTCLMGHPAGPDIVKYLLRIGVPFNQRTLERQFYLGTSNKLTHATCNKLMPMFAQKVTAFSQNPSVLFADEASVFISGCQMVWAYRAAERVLNDDSNKSKAIAMARLYSFVAKEHAATQQLTEPKLAPIAVTKDDVWMKILDTKEYVERIDSTRLQKKCLEVAEAAVGTKRMQMIKSEIEIKIE